MTGRRGSCRRNGCSGGWASPALARRPAITCGSSCRRSRCSTRCSRRSRRSVSTNASPGCATSCRPSAASRRSTPRRPSPASCATTSATGSAGCTSCAASASAAASPTTWASARPCRCWPCSIARAPAEASRPARRWSSCRQSLVFNWKDEAARFAPELRVLDYTGADRCASRRARPTTTSSSPPTARCAATRLRLKDVEFDYVILDEAQAIKNADTAVGQGGAAAQRASHRLALSGTPVENHLGELWSLFEFLNPGMLGTAVAPSRADRGPAAQRRAARPRELLARGACARSSCGARRRRWPRSCRREREQTLHCELEARAARAATTSCATTTARRCSRRIARDGMQKLEDPRARGAAAAAPGGVPSRPGRSKRHGDAPSAKLDALLPQLAELRRGRAQGAGLLAVHQPPAPAARRGSTTRAGSPTSTSTASTRDRQARVDRFQSDPDVPAVPDQPEGRRPGPEPDRRGVRVPARSLVEPGGRGAGDRPRAPHRPDEAGLRLSPHRPRHGRGEDRWSCRRPSGSSRTP